MSRRGFSLSKIAAGDYRLDIHGEPTIWRVAKHEGVGTGARGMHGTTFWGVERWTGRPGSPPDFDDPSQWEWAIRPGEYDTRQEAIDAAIREVDR